MPDNKASFLLINGEGFFFDIIYHNVGVKGEAVEYPVDKGFLALKLHRDRAVPLIFHPAREAERRGEVSCAVPKADALDTPCKSEVASYLHLFFLRSPWPFSIGESFLYIRKVMRQSIRPFTKVKGTLKTSRHFSIESTEGMIA